MRPKRPSKLRKITCVVLLAFLGASTLVAQITSNGYIALRQAVRDANSDRMVAIVASHPGDSYVMLASFLRFHYGFRVAVILFTRGEGGQNSRGPEVGDALGQRRTGETEASADRLGFKVWYLNRLDAGYCRTAKEALELWGKESTTHDLAIILRTVKPDVVVTTHALDETHGHDLGLLEVLTDAVDLAGDRDYLTPGMSAVDIPRLFRGASEGRSELELDMDRWDEVRGDTYRQFAYRAMTEEHLSQAPFQPMASLFDPLICLEGIARNGTKPANNLTQGLPTIWNSLSYELVQYNLEGLDELIERRRSLVRVALWLRHQLLNSELSNRDPLAALRLQRRIEALDRIIWHGSNLRVDIELTDEGAVVPGEEFHFKAIVHNGAAPSLISLELKGSGELSITKQIDTNHPTVKLDVTYRVPSIADKQRDLFADPFRRVTFERPISVSMKIGFESGKATVSLPPGSASDSFGIGEEHYPSQVITYPLRIDAQLRPPIELQVSPQRILIPDGRRHVRIAIGVRNNLQTPLESSVRIIASPGFVSVPLRRPVRLGHNDEKEGSYVFDLTVPEGLRPGVHQVTVRVGSTRIRVPVHRVAVTISPETRVGLIQGVDDSSAAILKAFGVGLDRLDDEDIKTRALSDLDTILIDIRALGHRRGMRGSFKRLLEHAHRGGRLVVLYHKDSEFAGIDIDPLKLVIGKGRVTNEDAPVEVLLPNHPLLNHPNTIRPSDWDGWVQERGLYFPLDYDDRFEELLAMSDPDQPRENSSLIYARYGEGEVIYCALSLFRQLKSFHPGACRLFANLIAK